MSEEGAEKYYREGSLSLPARVEQTQVGSSVVTEDSSFARAIVLRSRWILVEVLLPLRAAARAGVRVAAYRLRALSQIESARESGCTSCLFSRN